MQYQKRRDLSLYDLNKIDISDYANWDMETDYLVVWWWISGLHAAQNLIKTGKRVMLIEKNICGGGMSGRSAGFLTPDSEVWFRQVIKKYWEKIWQKIWNFAENGQRYIVDNINKYDLDADLLEEDSLLIWLWNAGKIAVQEEHQVRISNNLNSTLLIKEELIKYNTGQGYESAIKYSGCYNINPLKYCQELKKILIWLGVKIYEYTEVKNISANTITTNYWSIKFDKLIVCAGKIDKKIDDEKSKNIFGIQNFLTISEPLTESEITSIMPQGNIMCWDTDMVFTYYRITEDNRMLIGGWYPISSFLPFEVLYDTVIKYITNNTKKRFPILKDISFDNYRSGRIQVTKDLMPIVDMDKKYPNHIWVQWAAWLPRAAACGKYASDMSIWIIDSDLSAAFGQDRKFPLSFTSNSEIIKSITFWLSNYYVIS